MLNWIPTILIVSSVYCVKLIWVSFSSPLSSRTTTYWEVLVAVVDGLLVPAITLICVYGPGVSPSVEIVVRHLTKPLMHRIHSLNRNKGSEGIRDISGSCVDKHHGSFFTATMFQRRCSFAIPLYALDQDQRHFRFWMHVYSLHVEAM